jgi:hypothetical protein
MDRTVDQDRFFRYYRFYMGVRGCLSTRYWVVMKWTRPLCGSASIKFITIYHKLCLQ